MARSITEIYDEIVAEMTTFSSLQELQPNIHDAQTLLTVITTQSKVAIWKLYIWIFAVAAWVQEVLLDKHRLEVEQRALEITVGNIPWYRDQSFIFQFGDALQYINNKYIYPVIDESKQVIKRCSVIEAGTQVRIKVAKLSGTTPVKLSISELTSFISYIQQVKVAGTDVAVISEDADKLKVGFNVHYNPLVMSPTGELISEPGTYPVHDSINNYIQQLPFDGVLNLTKLIDAVQAAKGVVDPVLNIAEATYGNVPYVAIAREYNAFAGHMAIDTNYPLVNMITYTADV